MTLIIAVTVTETNCHKYFCHYDTTLSDSLIIGLADRKWVSGLAPKWVRLALNQTKPGLIQIRLQHILAP